MSVPFLALLPDKTGEHIALLKIGNRFRLPQFFSEEEMRFQSVTAINEAMFKDWHFPVTVARCLLPPKSGQPAVFAMHNQAAIGPVPPPAQWIRCDRISSLQFQFPEHRSLILDWLSAYQNMSVDAVPWWSSTWIEQAMEWISTQAMNLGATVSGVPIQTRAWAISCILRIPTTTGVLYFKALPDFFEHEPRLTLYLSQRYPQYMPNVVAIDPARHWLLTRELSGFPPRLKDQWSTLLYVLAAIQTDCANRIEALLSAGCSDRRLMMLPEHMRSVLDDLALMEMQQLYGVTEEEAEELSNRLQLLPGLCEELAACGIPDTLVHGDLWGSNIIFYDQATGKSPVILDWSDGAISHPFFDIFNVITMETDQAKKIEQMQAHVDAWSAFMPRHQVVRALRLSQRIAPYYYLLSYRHIVLNTPMQSRWELSGFLSRFVRMILQESPQTVVAD